MSSDAFLYTPIIIALCLLIILIIKLKMDKDDEWE